MNRTSLCIRMLMLLKSRGKMNTKELASELETKERNIREFKKELITAGYNIQEIKGRYGGYYLDEETIFPALKLTDEEIQALQEAREMIAHASSLRFSKEFNTAVDKIVHTNKDTHYSQRVYLGDHASVISMKEKEMIDTAQLAKEKGQCVQITYTPAGSNEKETYLVDPYEVIHYHNAYYMLGFSHKRNDIRMYRFSDSRMEQCEINERKFLRDSSFHIEQYIGKKSLIKGDFIRIKVKVNEHYRKIFEEVNWGLDMKEEDKNVFSFLVEDTHTFYRDVFSSKGNVQILSPEDIRNDYIQILEKTISVHQ